MAGLFHSNYHHSTDTHRNYPHSNNSTRCRTIRTLTTSLTIHRGHSGRSQVRPVPRPTSLRWPLQVPRWPSRGPLSLFHRPWGRPSPCTTTMLTNNHVISPNNNFYNHGSNSHTINLSRSSSSTETLHIMLTSESRLLGMLKTINY